MKYLHLAVAFMCFGTLGAKPNHLPTMLKSFRYLLNQMPKEVSSPYDPQVTVQHVREVTSQTHVLRGIQRGLMSQEVVTAVRGAPQVQKLQALRLVRDVDGCAKLFDVCTPGLISTQPFSVFPRVMRHFMREAGISAETIQEHLPYER